MTKINPSSPGYVSNDPIVVAQAQSPRGDTTQRTSNTTSVPPRQARLASTNPSSSTSATQPAREWGGTAALSHTLQVQFDNHTVPRTLKLPQGMLEHASINAEGLSTAQMSAKILGLLQQLPEEAATWKDGYGGINQTLGEHTLLVLFADDGRITSLSLAKDGKRVLALHQQAWLRGALNAAGVQLPEEASLWQLPDSGEPVACDLKLTPGEDRRPEAFKAATVDADSEQLMTQALDALSDGSAREHRCLGEGSAAFKCDVCRQPMEVVYQHSNHQVQRMRMSWNGQEVAQWGRKRSIDEELLALMEPDKRPKRIQENLLEWDESPNSSDMRDVAMGSPGSGPGTTGHVDADSPTSAHSTPRLTAVEKGKGAAELAPVLALSSSATPPAGSRAASPQATDTPEPLITIPRVLLSYRAREQISVDSDLQALAACFAGTGPAGRSGGSSGRKAGASAGTSRDGGTVPPAFNLSAGLLQFLDAVLQGEGIALPEAHASASASVRLFEKTFDKRAANVSEMDCVSQGPGAGTTVKLLALVRPDRPDRFTRVLPYSTANLAALNDAAKRRGDDDQLPLPSPGQINDALVGLFKGDHDAPLLRVLALLQTPGYRKGGTDLADLKVAADSQGATINGLEITGRDDPRNGASDNDWTRIVKPWLDQRTRNDDRIATHGVKVAASFKALATALPALGFMVGRGTPGEALQRAAAAALDAAGVPTRFLFGKDMLRTTVLKLKHVKEDGSCPPAKLSEAGRSQLRAWVNHRLLSLPDDPPKAEQPLFTYSGASSFKAAIATHWDRVA